MSNGTFKLSNQALDATSKTIKNFIIFCDYRAFDSNLADITDNVERFIDNGPSGFGNDLLLK